MATRQFHTAVRLMSRFPALQTRISRKAHEKNLQRIAQLKASLGDKYKPLGREKRRSPYTERRSPSKPSQPPPPVEREALMTPLMVSRSNLRPLDLNLESSLPLKERIKAIAAIASTNTTTAATTDEKERVIVGIRSRPAFKAQEAAAIRELRLSQAALPKLGTDPQSSAEPSSGPFYTFGCKPSEMHQLLHETPTVMVQEGTMPDKALEQAELVRRILSVDNASDASILKLNIARAIQLFQRFPADIGSPEVQAAVFSVRIQAMKKHMSANPKDMNTKQQLQRWTSKRTKMLQYLRRKDLPKFVETCRAIGVAPESIISR